MPIDALCSASLIGLAIAVSIVYALRSASAGRSRSERVERAGSSVLLGARAMESAYYALDPLAAACVAAGISANAVTAVSLALGLAAGAALAMGHLGVGALLAALSALGDALDGQVARRSGQASDAGEVVDAAVDRYVEFFFLGGLVIYYRTNVVALALTLGALLGSFMVSYSTAKAEALHVDAPRGAMRRAERAVYLTMGAALSPLAEPLLARIGLSSWSVHLPMVFALALVAAVANASAVQRLRAIARAVRVETQAAAAPLVVSRGRASSVEDAPTRSQPGAAPTAP